MVWDLARPSGPAASNRSASTSKASGIDPALTGSHRVKLPNGREIDAMPLYQMYQVHLQDYDLDTTHQITRAPKDLIVRWARSGTIKPAAMHNGEGVCHYFHMTENGPGGGVHYDHHRQHREIRHGLPYLVRQLQGRHLECGALVRRRPRGAYR